MSYAHPTPAECRTATTGPAPVRRLLIPVKDANDAGHAVGYAIRRRAEGLGIAVCRLHVEDAAPHLPARPRGSKRPGDCRHVFGPALQMLDGLDMEFAAYVRSGPVVFSILDAAEELDCDEIVVAAPGSSLLRLLSRDIVATLMARQRSVPVVTVGRNGVPQRREETVFGRQVL